MSDLSKHFFPAHRRMAQGTLFFASIVTLVGCGSNYRPVTTPITPTGPASQPTANAFIISAPSSSAPGIATLVDYSGDTLMATAPIGPGPVTFAINSSGSEAWSLDSDGTLANIPVSTNLQAKQIQYSTLNSYTGINPVVALFSGAVGLFALDVKLNQIDVLAGAPDAFKLTIPVDQSPVTMVGIGLAPRYYSISQQIPYLSTFPVDGQPVEGGVACNIDAHTVGVNGMADAIETLTYTVSAHIPLGICPVYAVSNSDARRVFVLNRGSDSISVINSQINTIDSCTCPPTGCVNQNGQTYTCHPSISLVPPSGYAGPVYAEYIPSISELIVANYEGNTVSVIDVSLDQYGNDSKTFGTVLKTIPVGNNPAAVTVLADASRAYVANQSDQTVTVINLSSLSVEKTLPVLGHPRTVVSTQNSLYGKVYVASPDSPYVTVIRTDQDIVSTTVLVQGNAVDVRTTSPDTTSANANTVSRLPGAGQPCYLPPSSFAAASAKITIAGCQIQDASKLATAP